MDSIHIPTGQNITTCAKQRIFSCVLAKVRSSVGLRFPKKMCDVACISINCNRCQLNSSITSINWFHVAGNFQFTLVSGSAYYGVHLKHVIKIFVDE